jgi:hypothetical protein
MPCLNVAFSFLVCFCFSPVGSGVDVSIEPDVKINNTDDQYLSINEQVKKKNPGFLLYFGYQQTRQGAPPLNLCFKVFQNLLFCTTRFNFLLSIDRVNLAKACSIIVN